MLHTIGKNIVLLEIQQSSDLTYRIYDYDRYDDTGRQRPLHLKKGLDVITYNNPIKNRNIYKATSEFVEVWDNPYFKIDLINISHQFTFPRFPYYGIATVVAGNFIVKGKILTLG
ncbi:MAG: hypothetical protein PHN29_06465 [Endomicrobiaceae bacterium]|nr:hypothetical protein [Endomicrobiaceae bacterium]